MTDLEAFLRGSAAMFRFRRQLHAIHTMPATDAAEVDELRRLLLEPSAKRGQGEDPGAQQGQAEAGEGVVDRGPQT